MIKKVINKCLLQIMNIPRKHYYLNMRKKLRNMNPTIISNNCIGGIIYHNLGLEFKSPTINLFLSNDDFASFVQDLEGYLSVELVEKYDETKDYPVGELTYNSKSIAVNFMHYTSFENAKKKWDERKERIDFNNIFIIWQTISATQKDVESFEKIPYKNKMLITAENPTGNKDIYVHEILSRENYRPGEVLEYKSNFAISRYMDDIDYVSFLNKSM